MAATGAESRAARLIAALGPHSLDGSAPAGALLLAGGDAIALLHALLDARAVEAPSPLRVVAIVSAADTAGWPALQARLPGGPSSLLPGLESLPVLPDGLALTLAVGTPSTVLRRLPGRFDRLLFADPSPLATGRAGHWQAGALARLAAPAARLVLAGPADEGLAAALRRAGFAIAPPSRDLSAAVTTPTDAPAMPMSDAHLLHATRLALGGPTAPPPRVERHALVIGAGLGGSAVAAALAHRGWTVTVLDRHEHPAREGSGQPLVVDHLHLSADDNPMARLTRAGARLARTRGWVGAVARPLGKLLLPADEAERRSQQAMLDRLALPPDWARMVSPDEARSLCGLSAPLGGLWLAQARVADPVAQCVDWLSRAGVTLRGGREIATLRRVDGRWQALDARGGLVADAPVAIVAAATASPALAGCPGIALERLAGQTTALAGPPLAALRSALGGAAYACPHGDGRVLVGSTFSDADDFAPDAAGDADNVARIAGALGLDASVVAGTVASRHGGVRCATRDRLPAIGPLPDEAAIAARAAELSANDRLPLPRRPDLYGVFGLGARGLLWSVLAAEVLAAHLAHEPPPLELDLLDAIDPARFARGSLRRGRFAAGTLG